MLLSILALAAMVGVAVRGAFQRLYHTALMLVALILAGALACILAGPLGEAVFSASADPRSTWYYAADALCFWAVLCTAFLAVRTLAEYLLPGEPELPHAVDTGGGAALGALAGYLAVGLCIMIFHMLPVAPAFLGYEPFRYREGRSPENPQRVETGDALWLAPDRAAVRFFDFVTGGVASEGGGALLGRYGDCYPPETARPEPYTPAVNADDFLYYHWYRRWRAVRWRTGRIQGPLAEIPTWPRGAHGLVLERNEQARLYGMKLQVYFAVRVDHVPGFPDVQPGEGREFLQVRLRMEPTRRLPRTIDTDQFYLVNASGERAATRPRVHGDARPAGEGKKGGEPVTVATAPRSDATNLRFAFRDDRRQGLYLSDGARFHFTETRHYEVRTLVFTVPKTVPTKALWLLMAPRPPAGGPDRTPKAGAASSGS